MGLLDSFFGGGDDGADQAAQIRADEAAREAKMQAAVDQINTIFGVRPAAVADPNAAKRQALLDTIAKYEALSASGAGPVPYTGRGPASTAGDSGASIVGRGGSWYSPDQLLAQARAQLAALPPSTSSASQYAAADKNKKAREAAYTKANADLMNYFRTTAGEQKKDAASSIAIDMARRGLTAGSASTDAYGNLEDDYLDRIQELSNRADSTVSGIRTADEDSRLGLISRIRQGMDVNSAISGANVALQNSIKSASESAKADPITGLFADIEDFYGQKRAYDAYRTGYEKTLSGVQTPGTGTVSTGSVSSYG